MRCLWLFLPLLGIPRADVESGRKALIEALTVGTRSDTIQAAVKYLAGCNDEAAAPALADGFEKGVEILKAAQKEVAKYAKDMEDSRVVYDQYGRYVKGKADVYMKAEENWKTAQLKAGTLDYWLPKVASALLDFKTDPQLKGCLKVLKSGSEFYVRGHAALALGRANVKEHTDALIESLKAEKDPTMRVALIDALAGHVKEDEALRDMVLDAVKAGDWQVQVAALQALRGSTTKTAAPTLITALKGAGGRMKHEINETLKAVTGVDKHGDYEAWKAWWDKNGDAFLAGTYVANPSEMAGSKGGSTFYGLQVVSTRLVFLIDTSGSMQEEPKWLPQDFSMSAKGTATRLEVAKFELKKAVTGLAGSAEFNVIVFHSLLEPYAQKIQAMDGAARTRCLKWIEAIKLGDGTHTWEALEEIYREAGGNFYAKNQSGSLDTVYLMTDGLPSSGVTNTDQFVEKVIAINRFKKIAIHTIGVDPEPNGEVLLQRIAESTGGSYSRR